MTDMEVPADSDLYRYAEAVAVVRRATDEIFDVIPELLESPFDTAAQQRIADWISTVGPANRAAAYLKESERLERTLR